MLAGGFVWDTGMVPVGLEASQTSQRPVNQNQNQLYMPGILYTQHISLKESPKLYTQKYNHKQTVRFGIQIYRYVSRKPFRPSGETKKKLQKLVAD